MASMKLVLVVLVVVGPEASGHGNLVVTGSAVVVAVVVVVTVVVFVVAVVLVLVLVIVVVNVVMLYVMSCASDGCRLFCMCCPKLSNLLGCRWYIFFVLVLEMEADSFFVLSPGPRSFSSCILGPLVVDW